MNPYRLIIGAQNFSEMVVAGRYSFVRPSINHVSHLFHQRSEPIRRIVHLICAEKFVSSEQALLIIRNYSLLPASLEEILAFGSSFPWVQKEFPIVELGTVHEHGRGGRRYVVVLGLNNGQRCLDTGHYDGRWGPRCRFMAIDPET